MSVCDLNRLHRRVMAKYRRTAANLFFRRDIFPILEKSIITFSFDDVPRTAITNGGDILNTYAVRGTYYVSLGILDDDSPSGVIASQNDLARAQEEGHELGCHTFDHRNSYETRTEEFVQSVLKNRQLLSRIFPEASFSSFAYPINEPRLSTKRRIGELFCCCRGGGQTYNIGKIDLNLLKAYFLDVRNADRLDIIKQLIDKIVEERGWLIFVTHDINDKPSRYGYSTKKFLEIVKYATLTGAALLPVGEACKQIHRNASWVTTEGKPICDS